MDRGATAGRAQRAAALALSCDRISVEVIGALQGAGIEPILLKGPSIARWLYPSGGRTYIDTDLLVATGQFGGAVAVLSGLGFTDICAGFHAWERAAEPVGGTTFVRQPRLGASPGGMVDLHRSLPFLPTPDELLWEALSADTEIMPIGDVVVRMLGRSALALHVVLHAVHHRFGGHTDEDLRRAIAIMAVDDWRPVADLAARLGIEAFLGLGLRHHPAGAETADALGLPSPSPDSSEFGMRFAPRGSVSLGDFWTTPLRTKARRVRRALLPSPAKVRYVSRLPDAGPTKLALAYARWWRDLAPAVVAAVRFLRGHPWLTRGGDG